MSIRLATLIDLPSIRHCWKSFVAEANPDYPRNIMASLDEFTRHMAYALANPQPTVFCFLSLDGDAPTGFLLFEVQERAYGEPKKMGFIHYYWVDPQYRGQGIGTQFAQLLGEMLLTLGISQCEMTVKPEDAQRWAYLGYTPYEVRTHVDVTHALLQHEKHQQERIGNGLDHSEVATPQETVEAGKED